MGVPIPWDGGGGKAHGVCLLLGMTTSSSTNADEKKGFQGVLRKTIMYGYRMKKRWRIVKRVNNKK